MSRYFMSEQLPQLLQTISTSTFLFVECRRNDSTICFKLRLPVFSKMPTLHATANSQKNLLQGRKFAQELQLCHHNPGFLRAAVRGEELVSHLNYPVVGALLKADGLDAVQ
jgi:hypothetical protein